MNTVTDGVPKSYAYDMNGNITGINNRVLTYNQDNRLTKVQEGSTILGEYTYNGLGQRVKKVAGTTTTIFHYDFDGNIIGESNLTGTFAKEYLYRSNNRLAMVETSTSEIYFFGNDSLGTPQILTNSTNTVVWEANYKPFGEAAVNQGSTVVNNFRFQGHFYDSETGLHYNYNRFYDPSTGRYLTPDPIGQSGGLNLFAYVDNNPINETDPLGLENKSIGKIKIGGKIYKFIPGDHHSVNPAEMHVHDRATGNKVGVETGNVYDPKGKKVIGKIKAKQLAKLKNVLRSTGYIASAVTILEIYDAMTAKNAKAFDNFLDTISILPPELQEEALQNALKERPELFEEIEEDLCE